MQMLSWEKCWLSLFWVSLPITVFLIWRITSMERGIQKLKKQIQRDIHSPGMEDVRDFLKPLLRKLGMGTDDNSHRRN